MWNARTPERFPDLIVQAESEDDLVLACDPPRRAEGMKIGIRSGGHSWAGNHVATAGCCSTSRGSTQTRSTPRR